MSGRRVTGVWLALVLVACSAQRPADSPGRERKTGPVDRVQPSPTEAAVEPDHERRGQEVTRDDLRILERALEILSDESRWNRKDDRVCPAGATSWSLYCALHDASLEVLGRYEHRRVALQEVRFAIEEVTKGRQFQHRMMDFNNLPATTLADVRGVVDIARRRVAETLKAE